MSNLVEVIVPDIGNFDSVDVIEVLVKVGDTVAKEDSLITLESDKSIDGYSHLQDAGRSERKSKLK